MSNDTARRFGGASALRAAAFFAWALITAALPAAPARSAADPAEGEGEKSCLECHEDYREKLAGEFNHKPFEEGECYACHRFHGFRNRVELKAPIIDLCTGCHADVAEMPSEEMHEPLLEEESCTLCHEMHGAGNAELLIRPGGAVCLECHDGPEDVGAVVHDPFAKLQCVACHEPHGSEFGSNLQMPAGYLCLSCHPDILPEGSPMEMHTADGEKSCENCHSPHGSDAPRLLKSAIVPLCTGCHVEKALGDELPAYHSAIDEGTCIACHDPHAKPGGKLLVKEPPDLCFGCHGEIEKRLTLEFPHAAADDDCLNCHDPHGRFQADDEPALCGECHEVGEKEFIAAHGGREPERCTTCHDPHGSEDERMLLPVLHPPFEAGECGECHRAGAPKSVLRRVALCLECHDAPERAGAHSDRETAGRACVECHSPHAARKSALVSG